MAVEYRFRPTAIFEIRCLAHIILLINRLITGAISFDSIINYNIFTAAAAKAKTNVTRQNKRNADVTHERAAAVKGRVPIRINIARSFRGERQTRSREPAVRRRNGRDKMAAAAFACSASTGHCCRHQWRNYGGAGGGMKEKLSFNILSKKKKKSYDNH